MFWYNQFCVFFAMCHGIKKAMDFWVPHDVFEKFTKMCDKHNILYRTDLKFVAIKDMSRLKETVVAGDSLTSTKFLWEEINTDTPWSIHMLLSMKQEYLDDIFQYAWYPIISDNRVINKVTQDIQDFGAALGYPHCCRKFFSEKNNWTKYSFLYEVYKKSQAFDYRCNCFWKDHPKWDDFSYIYHMPCSFGCTETIEFAQEIEQKLEEEWNTELLERSRYHLRLPCLVVREQKIYAFEGKVNIETQSIEYEKFFFLWNPQEDSLSKMIQKWNRFKVVNERHIAIYRNTTLIHHYDAYHQSEIEIPFIIQFG